MGYISICVDVSGPVVLRGFGVFNGKYLMAKLESLDWAITGPVSIQPMARRILLISISSE